MQEEQAPHHVVAGAGVEDGRARPSRLVQVSEDALEPHPVQVEDGLHDLPSVGPRRGVGESFHLPDQFVESLELRLELTRVGFDSASRSP